MARTTAQIEAIERDGRFFLWCIHQGRLTLGTDVHHLARRQPGADLPQLCITLCHKCHIYGHHNGNEPTTSQLLDLMLLLYGWNLRETYPYFFANR